MDTRERARERKRTPEMVCEKPTKDEGQTGGLAFTRSSVLEAELRESSLDQSQFLQPGEKPIMTV